MSRWHNPDFEEYRFDRQIAFSRYRRWRGAAAAQHAQAWVSMVRAMRRKLLSGRKPSMSDYPNFGHSYPSDFSDKRSFRHMRRAIDRGESHRSLALRGFFGPLSSKASRKRCNPPRATAC
jgi:hypothetical protein